MNKLTRRSLLAGGAVATSAAAFGYYKLRARPPRAPLGFEPDPDLLLKAKQVIENYPSWDSHAHPGITFAHDAKSLAPILHLFKAKAGFERRTLSDMRKGGLTGACFSAVSDFNVLNLSRERGLYARRPFEPGEAWASYRIQMENLKELAKNGWVTEVTDSDGITATSTQNTPRAIWTVEGGDFLEGSVERLRESYEDGIRSIALVHYRTNEIGDAMTSPVTHGTLTDSGIALVKEMNKLGMVVDLSHMSEAGVARAIAVSTKPVMISHTHVGRMHIDHPRFISQSLADLASSSGAILGAWPAGIGIRTLADFADRIVELVDAVGIDHVCLGTDMDANYKPVFDDYARLPALVSRLLEKGMHPPEIGAILGGNFIRVWKANLG